jgi:hypothetical protein
MANSPLDPSPLRHETHLPLKPLTLMCLTIIASGVTACGAAVSPATTEIGKSTPSALLSRALSLAQSAGGSQVLACELFSNAALVIFRSGATVGEAGVAADHQELKPRVLRATNSRQQVGIVFHFEGQSVSFTGTRDSGTTSKKIVPSRPEAMVAQIRRRPGYLHASFQSAAVITDSGWLVSVLDGDQVRRFRASFTGSLRLSAIR